MSVTDQGPGWWKASDGRYYPPTAQPADRPQPSPDGTSWWNGREWVAMPSRRHRWVGVVAIVLSALMAAYCAPMSVIGIADSRARADYDPGLFEGLYPLLLALPAIGFAVASIVVDRRAGERPVLGLACLGLVGLAVLALWFLIFA